MPANTDFDKAAVFARVQKAAMEGIVRGTENVRNEAVRLILSTPKTGKTYFRRGVEHRASAPGEAPASDTGRLVNSITTSYMPEKTAGRVTARTEYAAYLEFGTQTMEPRPFMRPALTNMIDRIEADVEGAISRVLGTK